MKKRLLSMILALALCLSLLPAVALAADETITSDMTIANGDVLTVAEGETLTIAEGVTLTIQTSDGYTDGGYLVNHGTIVNHGAIVNNWVAVNDGEITSNAIGGDPVLQLPHYSGGTGTQDDPYLLSSVADLQALNHFMAYGGANVMDTDGCGFGAYCGYYFQLSKDIDMTGEAWTPIDMFCGNFDGAGHTISNMQMHEDYYTSTDGGSYLSQEYESAFFGQLVNSTVKNLYFENCSAEIAKDLDPATSRDIYAAILAGSAVASRIENCSTINCKVEQLGKEANICYAGGLIGYADGCSIEDCSVQGGTVTIGGNAGNFQYAGGIVGAFSDYSYYYLKYYYKYPVGDLGKGDTFGILNSFSTADVTTSSTYGNGGITGLADPEFYSAVISGCYAAGTLNAGGMAGGIIGYDYASKRPAISNCTVLCPQISGNYADPIVGFLVGSAAQQEITGCKLSSETSVTTTGEKEATNIAGLTGVALTEDDYQISGFKSNLRGALADKGAGVAITLSNEDNTYTAVTDADGEYNFGKQVLPGTYTVTIAASEPYAEFSQQVTIAYATNETLNITRVASVTGVTISQTEISMEPGQTATLTANVQPEAATNKTVVWSSDNAAVATVDENGVVTAVAPGAAVITVTTEDGSFFASCTVTVQTPYIPPVTPVYPTTPTYPPEVDDTDNGSVSVTPARPSRGDKVTITPKPDAGYEVETVTVTDQNGDRVKVSRNADGTYSFIQPAGKVTVSVQFACNGGRYCPSRAFSDLDTSQWYHKATDFVIESGLMNGSGGKFYPDDVLTRAELAQILYNAEGKPAVSGQSAFTDVKSGAWYHNAVVWASGNGIVTGFSDDTFRPDEPITREQLAAMLYRYAQYKRYDTTQGGMAIREFSDYASISSYAATAMTWAVNTSVVGGFPDNTLRPQGSATRAQAAQMLMNFMQRAK